MDSCESWKLDAYNKLKKRNEEEISKFQNIYDCYEKLTKKVEELRIQNNEILLNNEQLKCKSLNGQESVSSSEYNREVRSLEKKVFGLQEELTSLHRKKAENAQRLYESNVKLQENMEIIQTLQEENANKAHIIQLQQEDIEELQKKMKEIQAARDLLSDEMATFTLLNTKLEEKCRELENDREQILRSAMAIKMKQIDQLNSQNDAIARKQQKLVEKELQDAISDKILVDEANKFATKSPYCTTVVLPKKELFSLDVHSDDVNTVVFSPDGGTLATAGNDRKVNIWTVGRKMLSQVGTLEGSNGGVTCVEFHPEGHTLIGSSNDSAVRLWSTVDYRQKMTLTGHAGKVLAARYTSDCSHIVTGSFDRTIKLWNVGVGKCIRTALPGSSCTDVQMVNELSMVVTGHFDSKLRCFDPRLNGMVKQVVLSGRITSLATFRDPYSIGCCTRDDSISILDLRSGNVLKTLVSDNFVVGADYTRMAVSPDDSYLACGGNHGRISVWNLKSGKEEQALEEHKHCVLDCTWSPDGGLFVSCDKGTTVKAWTD